MNTIIELSIAKEHCIEQITKLEQGYKTYRSEEAFIAGEEQQPDEQKAEELKWKKRLGIINQRIIKIIEEAIPV